MQNPTASNQWTVRRVIEWTTAHLQKHGSDTPRLDTEILLAYARGCRRIDLYTHFDDVLEEDERSVMRELVRRRAQAEPVAYLVGHREFFGLDFRVTPDVLVPRPDTETLVMELLEVARMRVQSPSPPGRGAGGEGFAEALTPKAESPGELRILDIGTGSGCIAVSAAVNLPAARVTAIDLSPAALEVARQNAELHHVSDRIRFLPGDLFAPLAAGEQFDIIACNPPYVTEGELAGLQSDVRLHEPRYALVGGADGLDVTRRLIAGTPPHLATGGHLLIEIAPEQAAPVRALLAAKGAYEEIEVVKDLPGRPRVVHARKAK
jgi:release factor glutamine methyltransferase